MSLLLSLTYIKLKDLQEYNIDLDKKKNILKCIGKDISKMTQDMIIDEYKDNISDIFLDIKGEIVFNISAEDLKSVENKSTGQINYYIDNNEYLPAYKASDPESFIIPISGKGLWSTLFGYFALEKDLNTVKGISFYKHGETPGLGGEVEKKWFQSNFIGKKIFNNYDELVSIKVVKGKAADILSDSELIHGVDGISGATITARGVSVFLKNNLLKYEPYIKKAKLDNG